MTSWIKIEHIDALPIRAASLEDLDQPRLQRHLEHARGVRGRDPREYLI